MIQVLPEIAPPPEPATAGAGTKTRGFVRRWLWIVIAVIALVSVTLLAQQPRYSFQDLHPNNHRPNGLMALNEILKGQGVNSKTATSLPDLEALISQSSLGKDGSSVTIFVPQSLFLTAEEWQYLASTGADVTIGGSRFSRLEHFTRMIKLVSGASNDPLLAQCSEPDGQAASRISRSDHAATIETDGPVGCFPVSPESYAYLVWDEHGGTHRYIADPSILTNAALADDGNAALGLRALGHNKELIWYLPESEGAGIVVPWGGFFPSMPRWFAPALFVTLASILVLALATGRRMGRVVLEPLPVVVKSGEATTGRGRLYHKTASTAHAAAGIRAGVARRLAGRLGIPRSASANQLIDALVAATRRSSDELAYLFYGPPPRTSAELVQLANELHSLEDEVHYT